MKAANITDSALQDALVIVCMDAEKQALHLNKLLNAKFAFTRTVYPFALISTLLEKNYNRTSDVALHTDKLRLLSAPLERVGLDAISDNLKVFVPRLKLKHNSALYSTNIAIRRREVTWLLRRNVILCLIAK